MLGYVAVGAGLSQVFLTASLLAAGHLDNLSRRLFGLLMFAVLAYLLMPLFQGWSGLWMLGAASTLVPGAFWLFCASLFDDHYEFPLWQPVLVALSVILPTTWFFLGSPAGGLAEYALVDLPQLGEFVFLVMAIYSIFRSWRDDLVTTRRTLRLWFCSSLGAFILLMILAREVLFAGQPWLDMAQYLATAIVATGTNLILMRFRPGLLGPPRRSVAEPGNRPRTVDKQEYEKQLQPVVQLVEKQAIHREWGMTIGKLASLADMPEYRLRQLINSGLGYRNFNDFLNRFRIEEASRRLADPDQAKTPVLTIALEAGFRSISTFNKAFKEIHGVTPSAYRKSRL